MRTSRGPAILPPIEIHPDELLSNWRKLVCASGLTALPREVAAGSVVLELTEDHVLLRPRSRMLLTPDVVHLIEGAMKRLKGESFQVKFDAQEHEGKSHPTLSLWEESERRAARLAMIEAFKSDPFVQECLRVLDGELDETSVRKADN